jgi:tRNA threonylcarbamoyladenosine biosynthesis protein TsaB
LLERVLIIETSGKIGQVAVAASDGILDRRLLPEARRHARDLAARSAELLAGREWRARDLTAVIVCTGPGSFTGLRVGIASAKALAYAAGRPLYGVPAFTAIAARINADSANLEIIADALQGQVYCQGFERTLQRWKARDEIRIRPFAEWMANVAPQSLIAGPAMPMYRDRLPAQSKFADELLCEPDCASLLDIVQRDAAQWQADPWEIEPIYLRGSSAEEKRRQGL